MARKVIGLRGIDEQLYDRFKKIVASKYDGMLRNKYSNVAYELNDLIRQYVASGGKIVTHTHKPIKEQVRDATKYGIPAVEEVLDDNGIVEDRSRSGYISYAERLIERQTFGSKIPKKDEVMYG